MYRRDQERKAMETEQQFFQRVGSLPVVTAAMSQFLTLYGNTKERSRLIKYTLEMGESGAQIAVNSAKPIIGKFEKPIGSLDTFACTQLDKLEESYPILTKPADQVYDATLKPTVEKVAAVHSYATDKAAGVKDYTMEKVNGVKDLTYIMVNGAKEKSVNTVGAVTNYSVQTAKSVASYGGQKLDAALQTPYGQIVATRVDSLIEATDKMVDQYIPSENKEGESAEGSGMEVDEAGDTTVSRATNLGFKLSRRLSTRSMSQLQNLQVRSKETLDKLTHTVNLIEYAKSNLEKVPEQMGAAKDKVVSVWNEINLAPEEVEEKEVQGDGANTLSTQTFERRAIATARHLTHKLKQGMTSVSEQLPSVPETLKERIDQAKQAAEDMYSSFAKAESFNDVPQKMLEMAKDKLGFLQGTFTMITEYMSSNKYLSWMMPQKIEPLELEDIEPETEMIQMGTRNNYQSETMNSQRQEDQAHQAFGNGNQQNESFNDSMNEGDVSYDSSNAGYSPGQQQWLSQ